MKSKIILILTLLFFCVAPAPAQIETLFNGGAISTEEKPIKEIREQLEKWQKEVNDDLTRLEKFENPEQLPAGVEPSLLNTRRRHLEQSILAINRHLLILDELSKAKEAVASAQKSADEWQGFGKDSPTSILKLDELVSNRDALSEKIASNSSSLNVFETSLSTLVNESKAADERISAAVKAYEAALKNDPVTLWKLETERAGQRFIFIRASSLTYGIAAQKEIIRTSEIELGTINKKIDEVRNSVVLTKDDLALITTASSDRQKQLRKETSGIRKRLQAANIDKVPANALAKLRQSTEQVDPVQIERAELDVEALESRKRSLQAMIDSLETFEQVEAFIPEAYELRFDLFSAKSDKDRSDAIAALISLDQRLNSWEIVTKNRLSSVSADIANAQTRAASFATNDPRLDPLNRIRADLWELQSIIQRASESVSTQRRLLASWTKEYENVGNKSWYTHVSGTFSRAWKTTKAIWNTPVNRYEEIIEIDGKKIPTVRFVSLGSIITALILFVITYIVAGRISKKIQRAVIHRGMIGENQARTLRTWLMLVVGFILALATLKWLNIPLTMFAFLAGALAIGIGFGTQTIIKNFISGVILLFERKVRVGDIIEVNGINGVVTEINTRSSIVRCPNGTENLIPNALFLENRVVNWTLNSRLIRREIKIGVPHGTPTNEIIKMLTETADRHGLILSNPAPFATFTEFTENFLDFTVYFWIELNDRTNGLIVDSDVRIMIEKRLQEFGIGVPSPNTEIPNSDEQDLSSPSIEQETTSPS